MLSVLFIYFNNYVAIPEAQHMPCRLVVKRTGHRKHLEADSSFYDLVFNLGEPEQV